MNCMYNGNVRLVAPEYKMTPAPDGETYDALRGGLYAWEVQEYAKVTGQTMEQAMQDPGMVVFAMIPMSSRGTVIDLLEWVAKPIDS